MNAANRWQEVVAGNLSAGFVPGFKRQELAFREVQAGAVARMDGARLGNNARIGLPATSISTNFLQGELQPTQQSTDVALSGPGFFEVQLPDGQTAYTRDGQFRFDAQGQLVTNQGYPLIGDSGPLRLDPSKGPLSISPTGEVSQGGEARGRIKVTEFNDPSLLTPLGGGMFASRDPNLAASAANATTLRQGFTESSNTSSAAEMASLIGAMRMHEAGQRLIQTQDDLLGKTITELAPS